MYGCIQKTQRKTRCVFLFEVIIKFWGYLLLAGNRLQRKGLPRGVRINVLRGYVDGAQKNSAALGRRSVGLLH